MNETDEHDLTNKTAGDRSHCHAEKLCDSSNGVTSPNTTEGEKCGGMIQHDDKDVPDIIGRSINYKGVSKANSKFQATVCINNKENAVSLGTYILKADAAWAYDIGADAFSGIKGRARNFETVQEYEIARKQELKEAGTNIETVGLAADIDKKIQQRISEIQNGAPKQKTSAFKGVSKATGSSKYLSQIYHNKKVYDLGNYELECDAAWCYDEAAKSLKSSSSKVNFETTDQFPEEREREIAERGVDANKIASVGTLHQLTKSRVEKIPFEHRFAMATQAPADITESQYGKCLSITEALSPNSAHLHKASKEPRSSKFAGVYYDKVSKRYRTELSINGKVYAFGNYHVETDSAWCYDRALHAFDLAGIRRTNFESLNDYKAAREEEIKACKLKNTGDQSKVTAKMEKHIDHIRTRIEKTRMMEQGNEENNFLPNNGSAFDLSERIIQVTAHSNTVFEGKRNHHGRKPKNKTKTARLMNTITDVLTEKMKKKWGPLLTDHHSKQTGLLKMHQITMESLLSTLRGAPIKHVCLSSLSETSGNESSGKKRKNEDDPLKVKKKSKGTDNSNKTVQIDRSFDKQALLKLHFADTIVSKSTKKRMDLSTTEAQICTTAGKDILQDIIPFEQNSVPEQDELNDIPLANHTVKPSPDISRANQTIKPLKPSPPDEGKIKEAPKIQSKAVTLSPPIVSDDKPIRHSSNTAVSNNSTTKAALNGNDIITEHNTEAQPESEDTVTKSQQIAAKANISRSVIESELILFKPEQTSHFPFPTGCKVWWGFQSDSEGEYFNHGTVHNVYFNFSSRKMMYEVTKKNEQTDKEPNPNLLLEEEIAYAPGSHVYYSPSGSFDDDASRAYGEVLYCRTNSSDNTNEVKEINVSLKNEHISLKSNITDAGCIERIHIILQKLDKEIFIDRSILKETGIGRTIKSISKLLKTNDKEVASFAIRLIEKWRAQIARPQLLYSLLIFGDKNEIQLKEDVPFSHIKFRH